MVAGVTKRVRMDAEMLELLRMVAAEKGMTESDVLRSGVRMQADVVRRAKAVDALMEVLESCEPDGIKFEGRP